MLDRMSTFDGTVDHILTYTEFQSLKKNTLKILWGAIESLKINVFFARIELSSELKFGM
jgi:hypothetical protein